MASIWAKDKRIAVRFKIKGKSFVTTVPIKPTVQNIRAFKKVAEEKEALLRAGTAWEVVRADLRGEKYEQPGETLGYYAQHYLDTVEVDESSTLKSYQSLYNRYWLQFDQRTVSSLLQSELKKALNGHTVSLKTKKNALSVLSAILKGALADKAITSSPTDGWFIKQTKIKRVLVDPYTVEERDLLLSSIDNDIAYRFFYTAFFTGMRTGELLGLHWDNLSPEKILVKESMRRRLLKDSTKTNTERIVPIPSHLWKVLESSPSRWRKGLVFTTPTNLMFKDADWLMEFFKKAHDTSKVKRRLRSDGSPRPYPWRSTYISNALSSGMSLGLVAEIAGDNPTTIQKHYHKYMDMDGHAKSEVERVFGENV